MAEASFRPKKRQQAARTPKLRDALAVRTRRCLDFDGTLRPRPNYCVSCAFSAKIPVDCRLFLQKRCRPGTKARIIIGHCVIRSFVFIYISGSTFVFNIFMVGCLPERLFFLCHDVWFVVSPRPAEVQRRVAPAWRSTGRLKQPRDKTRVVLSGCPHLSFRPAIWSKVISFHTYDGF